jgi:hypothetical protein
VLRARTSHLLSFLLPNLNDVVHLKHYLFQDIAAPWLPLRIRVSLRLNFLAVDFIQSALLTRMLLRLQLEELSGVYSTLTAKLHLGQA